MLPAGFMVAGRYQIRRLLARAGQGEVYVAYDQNERDTVALKLLAPTGHPLGPWAEAVVLRHLQDHHILPIRNAHDHLGQPYMVTTLAAHGSVADRVAAAGVLGLDVDTAVTWIRQACHGVARGNDAGLLHNDVKPANLFLNARDECVVADWGGAGLIDAATGFAPVHAATPQTAAPEVAAAWSSRTPLGTVRSDVYSLGATAYVMIAGRSPHDFAGAMTIDQQMAVVASTPPARLGDIAPHAPRWIRDRIEKAMAQEPGKRFDSAHAFASALGQRPHLSRQWRRTDEHAGHIVCWRGDPTSSGTTYTLCMEQGSAVASRVLTTRTVPSGRKVARGCAPATRSTWPRVVRRLIDELA